MSIQVKSCFELGWGGREGSGGEGSHTGLCSFTFAVSKTWRGEWRGVSVANLSWNGMLKLQNWMQRICGFSLMEAMNLVMRGNHHRARP